MEHNTHNSLRTVGSDFHRAFENALTHLRKRLGQTHLPFINGQSIKSKSGTFTTCLPSNTRILAGRFQKTTQDHARRAVAAAKNAGELWREIGWQQRISYLRKAAELLASHKYELAAMISLEVGKIRVEAVAEVTEAIETILYYCHETERHQGFVFRTNGSQSEHHQCMLRPHGVWALITPFNAPLSVAAGATAAALAGGNTLVLKPSSRAPWTGTRFGSLLQDAGLPVGVFNLLTGSDSQLGKALVGNPGLNGIAFIGTTENGLNLRRQFAGEFPRPFLAAMGGKNPVIVMPTADIEDAADGILRAAFAFNGQHYAASARVYAHRKIYKHLMDCLAAKVGEFKIGDPLDQDTSFGPLIDAESVARFKQAVSSGKKQGRIVRGGNVLKSGVHRHGYYVEPTIVAGLPAGSRLFKTELLAPVLAVAEVRSLAEAITLANDSIYGQAAGIFTQAATEQVMFFNQIESAAAYCNRREGATIGAWPGKQSVGGWKASGCSCRNAMGPFYVAQFLREQSQTLTVSGHNTTARMLAVNR